MSASANLLQKNLCSGSASFFVGESRKNSICRMHTLLADRDLNDSKGVQPGKVSELKLLNEGGSFVLAFARLLDDQLDFRSWEEFDEKSTQFYCCVGCDT